MSDPKEIISDKAEDLAIGTSSLFWLVFAKKLS